MGFLTALQSGAAPARSVVAFMTMASHFDMTFKIEMRAVTGVEDRVIFEDH